MPEPVLRFGSSLSSVFSEPSRQTSRNRLSTVSSSWRRSLVTRPKLVS